MLFLIEKVLIAYEQNIYSEIIFPHICILLH
jgi:hypothetical protein